MPELLGAIRSVSWAVLAERTAPAPTASTKAAPSPCDQQRRDEDADSKEMSRIHGSFSPLCVSRRPQSRSDYHFRAPTTPLPSGHAVGAGTLSLRLSLPRDIARGFPEGTSRFFFIPFLGQRPIHPGVRRPRPGKGRVHTASRRGAPTHESDTSHRLRMPAGLPGSARIQVLGRSLPSPDIHWVAAEADCRQRTFSTVASTTIRPQVPAGTVSRTSVR